MHASRLFLAPLSTSCSPLYSQTPAKVKTAATKVSLLLQLKAGGFPLNEFHYTDWPLAQNSGRILRALVDFLEVSRQFEPLCGALLLQRSLLASVGWHDDPAAGVRQLSGVGVALMEKLKEGFGQGGKVSLQSLAELTPSRLELVSGKAHPWCVEDALTPRYARCTPRRSGHVRSRGPISL